MNEIEKLLEDKEIILCLLPSYEKSLGDITKILLKNGDEILHPQPLESSLKSIANYFGLHLRLIRKKQKNLLNSKYYLPLPLHHNLLLFPIKFRIPKIKNDTSLAYINYFEVDKIDYRKSSIYLSNGKSVHSLNTSTTLRKRYHQAKVSSKFYKDTISPKVTLAEEKVDYFYPATRGDMKDIKEELFHIQGILSGILEALPKKDT